jgi:gluconate 2-dehydrogenase gamma chain
MSFEDGNRREALKILGAIGGTCAFPFSANELYGQQTPVTQPQHVHQHAGPPERPPSVKGPIKPGYFSEPDFDTISRLADLIIPHTDTPGAVEAGVPAYIDSVVGASAELQAICQVGLKAFEERSQKEGGLAFAALTMQQQVAVVTPLSEVVDAHQPESAAERFFHLIKNLTADGYYTSHAGLVEELKYTGNTVLDRFPQSTIREH